MKPELYDKFGNSIKYKLPSPSSRLVDKSKMLTREVREKIIDLAAKCVNENKTYILGRASMCLQFAILVKYMLEKENVQALVVGGQAEYWSGVVRFKWQHYWVETKSGEIIDCNIDSIIYHPESPETIHPYNYWGATANTPSDRIFSDKRYLTDSTIKQLEVEEVEIHSWKSKIEAEY